MTAPRDPLAEALRDLPFSRQWPGSGEWYVRLEDVLPLMTEGVREAHAGSQSAPSVALAPRPPETADPYVTCGIDGCDFAVERGEGRTMALHKSEDHHETADRAAAWRDQLSGEHVAHRGNHEGYACGFSGPHCWECFEPWPCRTTRGVTDAPSPETADTGALDAADRILNRLPVPESVRGNGDRELGWAICRNQAREALRRDATPALDVERVMDAEHRWCVQVDGEYALRHQPEAHRRHAEYVIGILRAAESPTPEPDGEAGS